MTKFSQDKIAGCLYGGALGDALGLPTEFMKIGEIYRRFGRTGHMRLPSRAHVTDDTQMTLRVAQALRLARGRTPREVARTLRRQYVAWMRYDPPRAPGVTCLTAIRRLARGARWREATNADSKGCGANMRVAPVAFLPRTEDVAGVAQLQAALTHGHPVALAASELTALAIRWAAQDCPLERLPEKLLAHARKKTIAGTYERSWLGDRLPRRWKGTARDQMTLAWSRMTDACVDVIIALADDTVTDPCEVLGQAWVADEAFATALYCAVRYRHDPVEAISRAARTNGDSDSIASIAGQVVGARYGLAAWSADWVRRVENTELIASTARNLVDELDEVWGAELKTEDA